MNTRDLERLDTWEEGELTDLVARYVRTFHRLPDYRDLVRFKRALGGLHLRLPRHGARKPQTVVASL